MNAATVMGPRSWIASRISNEPDALLLLAHGDEDFAAFVAAHPPHEDPGDSARLHLLQLAAGFRRRRHASAVYRQNDVALTQRAGGRAVRIDIRNHGAHLARRQLHPPRHLRRDVAQREAETLL